MWCMGLEHGQAMEEDGGVLEDGPTVTDLIGDGVVLGGRAHALALGALITSTSNLLYPN